MSEATDLGFLVVAEVVKVEAEKLAKVLKLDDPIRVITKLGQCRVHLARDGEPKKRCSCCKHHYTHDSFNKNRANSDGLQARCRQCDHTTLRERYHDEKVKMKRAAGEAAREAKREVMEELRGNKGKIVRTTWPLDPEDRRKAITKVLPRALMDYDGQEAEMSVCLCLPVEEIRNAIAMNANLQRIAEHAKTVAVSKVEANAYKMAKESNNAAAIKFWLLNNTDRWNDKSTIEMKNVGFSAPTEDAEPAPILKIVNYKPED